jgi:hypothetical protein
MELPRGGGNPMDTFGYFWTRVPQGAPFEPKLPAQVEPPIELPQFVTRPPVPVSRLRPPVRMTAGASTKGKREA